MNKRLKTIIEDIFKMESTDLNAVVDAIKMRRNQLHTADAHKFRVGDMVLGDCFDAREITKESKSSHFRRLKERYLCDYEDMLFFDNEYGNCQDVSSIGVSVCYCPDGVTRGAWDLALESFPSPGEIIHANW